MAEEIKHYQINGKYRICFEQSAVKGVIGFKVEANGDILSFVEADAESLLEWAKSKAPIVTENK